MGDFVFLGMATSLLVPGVIDSVVVNGMDSCRTRSELQPQARLEIHVCHYGMIAMVIVQCGAPFPATLMWAARPGWHHSGKTEHTTFQLWG